MESVYQNANVLSDFEDLTEVQKYMTKEEKQKDNEKRSRTHKQAAIDANRKSQTEMQITDARGNTEGNRPKLPRSEVEHEAESEYSNLRGLLNLGSSAQEMEKRHNKATEGTSKAEVEEHDRRKNEKFTQAQCSVQAAAMTGVGFNEPNRRLHSESRSPAQSPRSPQRSPLHSPRSPLKSPSTWRRTMTPKRKLSEPLAEHEKPAQPPPRLLPQTLLDRGDFATREEYAMAVKAQIRQKTKAPSPLTGSWSTKQLARKERNKILDKESEERTKRAEPYLRSQQGNDNDEWSLLQSVQKGPKNLSNTRSHPGDTDTPVTVDTPPTQSTNSTSPPTAEQREDQVMNDRRDADHIASDHPTTHSLFTGDIPPTQATQAPSLQSEQDVSHLPRARQNKGKNKAEQDDEESEASATESDSDEQEETEEDARADEAAREEIWEEQNEIIRKQIEEAGDDKLKKVQLYAALSWNRMIMEKKKQKVPGVVTAKAIPTFFEVERNGVPSGKFLAVDILFTVNRPPTGRTGEDVVLDKDQKTEARDLFTSFQELLRGDRKVFFDAAIREEKLSIWKSMMDTIIDVGFPRMYRLLLEESCVQYVTGICGGRPPFRISTNNCIVQHCLNELDEGQLISEDQLGQEDDVQYAIDSQTGTKLAEVMTLEQREAHHQAQKKQAIERLVSGGSDLKGLRSGAAPGTLEMDLADQHAISVPVEGLVTSQLVNKKPGPSAEIKAVMQALMSHKRNPQDLKQPHKRSIYDNPILQPYFTRRGCLTQKAGLEVLKYSAGELGIPNYTLDMITTDTLRHRAMGPADENRKVNGAPRLIAPRTDHQDRTSTGQFQKGTKSTASVTPAGFDPFATGTDTGLNVRAAILYAIANRTLSAEDLGMQRFGSQWQSLYYGAVSCCIRMVEADLFVEETRRWHADLMRPLQRALRKYQAVVPHLQRQNEKLKQFIRDNVAHLDEEDDDISFMMRDIKLDVKKISGRINQAVPALPDRRFKTVKNTLRVAHEREDELAKKAMKKTAKTDTASSKKPAKPKPGSSKAGKPNIAMQSTKA